jgi:hypothetical protein
MFLLMIMSLLILADTSIKLLDLLMIAYRRPILWFIALLEFPDLCHLF